MDVATESHDFATESLKEARFAYRVYVAAAVTLTVIAWTVGDAPLARDAAANLEKYCEAVESWKKKLPAERVSVVHGSRDDIQFNSLEDTYFDSLAEASLSACNGSEVTTEFLVFAASPAENGKQSPIPDRWIVECFPSDVQMPRLVSNARGDDPLDTRLSELLDGSATRMRTYYTPETEHTKARLRSAISRRLDQRARQALSLVELDVGSGSDIFGLHELSIPGTTRSIVLDFPHRQDVPLLVAIPVDRPEHRCLADYTDFDAEELKIDVAAHDLNVVWTVRDAIEHLEAKMRQAPPSTRLAGLELPSSVLANFGTVIVASLAFLLWLHTSHALSLTTQSHRDYPWTLTMPGVFPTCLRVGTLVVLPLAASIIAWLKIGWPDTQWQVLLQLVSFLISVGCGFTIFYQLWRRQL